jgi:DNA end-binding protein Ku
MKSKKTPRARTKDDDGRPEAENVVDLMDALKKSLKEGKSSRSGATARSGAGSGGTRRKKAS